MIVRMYDATSLYKLRDPTDEEQELSEIPFSLESLEAFTAWMVLFHFIHSNVRPDILPTKLQSCPLLPFLTFLRIIRTKKSKNTNGSEC